MKIFVFNDPHTYFFDKRAFESIMCLLQYVAAPIDICFFDEGPAVQAFLPICQKYKNNKFERRILYYKTKIAYGETDEIPDFIQNNVDGVYVIPDYIFNKEEWIFQELVDNDTFVIYTSNFPTGHFAESARLAIKHKLALIFLGSTNSNAVIDNYIMFEISQDTSLTKKPPI